MILCDPTMPNITTGQYCTVCKQTRQESRCLFNEFDNPEKAWKIAGLPKFDGVHFVTLDGENFHMEDYC